VGYEVVHARSFFSRSEGPAEGASFFAPLLFFAAKAGEGAIRLEAMKQNKAKKRPPNAMGLRIIIPPDEMRMIQSSLNERKNDLPYRKSP
jgi:hypothetical protein